ncbi:anti-sigma factor family protein [Streptomyces ochraceiscleroticus]|uniref:Anti-sigma factor family protein n=1 Tax=Streptomyces ochraceiscleroticus TaxID=47761 RepID=A0ABW1MC47_9ACTN|nr:zf-HC2 domain-containing protein [Streptomyces ochraceiscleroticus]
MSGSGGQSPAEQHLGDRLAALVDGELGHDQRERVLAHLATCGKCKAEADAQRELKNVFAGMAPPGPSDGLLARLQGLPGGDPGAPAARLGEGGLGRGGFGRGGLDGGGFGRGAMSFAYAPSGAHAVPGMLPERGFPERAAERGFPVHGRGGARPATGAGAGAAPGVGSPRRRFAFVAAGAVSLAAFALSGALPLEAAVDTAGEGANSPLTASSADASGAVGERPGAGRGSRDRDALLGVLQGRATPAAASAEFYPAAASLPVNYASPSVSDRGARLSPLIAPGPSGASGSGTASGLGTDAGSGAVAGTSVGASPRLPGAGTGAVGGTDGPAGASGGGPLPSALASPAAPATSYPAAPLPPLEPKRPLLTRSASAAP